jgi:hypothetical protein
MNIVVDQPNFLSVVLNNKIILNKNFLTWKCLFKTAKQSETKLKTL